MSEKRTELAGKEKFLSQLSSFLEKNKIILLTLLGVIVALIIVIAIINSVQTKKANESAFMIEKVQKTFEEWVGMDDENSDKAAKLEELSASLDNITNEYPVSYAAQRAFYLKASISFDNSMWHEAASLYLKSAEVNMESYLAPIALMLAASSYENAENYQEALNIYQDIYNSYDKIYPDVPRAMLSIGRLYEQLDDTDSAIEAYNKLIDSYPGSGWSNFARTRLIQID